MSTCMNNKIFFPVIKKHMDQDSASKIKLSDDYCEEARTVNNDVIQTKALLTKW